MGERFTPGPHAALVKLAEEFWHVRSEHGRTGAEGTTRRRIASRMQEIEHRFDRLLATWEPDDDTRAAWRRYLADDGAPPAEPEGVLPPAFRGVRPGGARVEVHPRPEGDFDLVVDGLRAARIDSVPDVSPRGVGAPLVVGGVECRETFRAPEEALDALDAFVAAPEGTPPPEHTRALYEDGLIGADLGLTPRGRRALAARRGA